MRMTGFGVVLAAALWPAALVAGPQHILVGLDGKTFFEPGGSRNGPNGGDAIAVLDASDPARPVVAHILPLANSVYGPPTNLQITPDGRLGLVASSVVMVQDGPNWWAQPDDKLHVLDLEAAPPRLVETITVGRQPSGLAVHPRGDLALVANRAGKSVSVLSIAGGRVRHLGEVATGDEEVAAVAIAPDGRRAYVAKNKAGKIGVLRLDGQTVAYDPSLDMPVGAGVYAVEVTPDGALALTANTGPASDGHADTASVIRLDQEPPRVVDHVAVGDTPEVLAIAPDGRHAVAAVVRGSSAPHGAWSYTRTGSAVLLAIEPGAGGAPRVRVADEAEAGALPEGIAFSPGGDYVYLGNYVDRNIQVYRIEGGRLVNTGVKVALPGQPASMRGPAPRARAIGR